MIHDLETTIQLPDEEDVEVLIDFTVESWGSPGTGPSWNHPGDPPEGPEFEITKITRCDSDEDILQIIFGLSIEYYRKIDDLVAERIYELDVDRSYYPDY